MSRFELVTEYLEKGEIGDFVEYDGRTVEVVAMAGGRFLCLDRNGDVVRLVGDPAFAYNFLMNYKGDDGYDPCG